MVEANSRLFHCILVTDDDMVLRRFYKQALQEKCDDLIVVEQPEQAIQILHQRPVDFLITDLKLSAQTGVDIIQVAVKKQPNISILVASGYVSDTEFEEQLKRFTNVKGLMQKPFTADELLLQLDIIASACGNHRA